MPRNQAIGRPIVLAIILTVGLGVVWAWLAISTKSVWDQFFAFTLRASIADGACRRYALHLFLSP